MLPQIQVSNKRPNRPKRPRPINPSDTAATTGLAVNPNGTYVANPYPTTAAIGGTGAYGAMLPAVNMGNSQMFGPPRPLTFGPPQPYGPPRPITPAISGLAPIGYGNNVNGQPVQQAGYMGLTPSQAQAPIAPGGSSYTPGRFAPEAMTQHMQNIATNPNYINTVSPETRSALLRMMGQQDTAAQTPTTGPGGRPLTAAEGGNTDYAQTAAARWNAENNVPFLQQKRWDGKKFVTLDRFFRQQAKQRRNDRRRGSGDGGNNQQSQARQNPQAQASYTLSSAFTNFGTATG